jgi:hypothetical protein
MMDKTPIIIRKKAKITTRSPKPLSAEIDKKQSCGLDLGALVHRRLSGSSRSQDMVRAGQQCPDHPSLGPGPCTTLLSRMPGPTAPSPSPHSGTLGGLLTPAALLGRELLPATLPVTPWELLSQKGCRTSCICVSRTDKGNQPSKSRNRQCRLAIVWPWGQLQPAASLHFSIGHGRITPAAPLLVELGPRDRGPTVHTCSSHTSLSAGSSYLPLSCGVSLRSELASAFLMGKSWHLLALQLSLVLVPSSCCGL